MRRQLHAVEREGRGLNGLQVGNQRATGRTALDVTLEFPLPGGVG